GRSCCSPCCSLGRRTSRMRRQSQQHALRTQTRFSQSDVIKAGVDEVDVHEDVRTGILGLRYFLRGDEQLSLDFSLRQSALGLVGDHGAQSR
ncbi:hypothetical protein PENTCL1PPCAC_25498, partial [Pristionchus entomophagus]